MHNFLRRGMAFLLLIAMLISVLPSAFAAEHADPEETTEATTRATTTLVPDHNTTFSNKKILAYWINPSSSSFTVSDANIDNLVNRGVTDFYVLVKGEVGTLNTEDITNIISYADGKARVHAWIICARDNNYIKSNPTHAAYHYRYGYKNSCHDESSSYYYDRIGYVDLRNTSYQTYFNQQIDKLEAIDGLSGIHLDGMRYGADYYGWGTELQNALGATYFNEVAKALCAHHGYTYKTSNGFYVFNSFVDGSADSTSLATLVNANGAAAKAYREYREQTIISFVSSVKKNLKSGLTLSVAVMPESADTLYGKAIYGQNCALLKDYIDYAVAMSYFGDYYAYNGNKYDTTFPADIAKAIAKEGCNVVAGIQAYAFENTDTTLNGYNPDGVYARAQAEYINDARRAVNGDITYGGDILGASVFRAGTSAQVKISYNSSKQTITFSIVNGYTAVKSYRIDLYNGFYIDKSKCTVDADSETYTYSGNTFYYGGTASNGYYPRAGYTLSLAAYGTKSITIPVCNNSGAAVSTSYNNNNFAAITLYNSTSKSDTTCLPSYHVSYVNSSHTSCSFTKTTPVAATCTTPGYNLYTCSTCGYDYTEYIATGGHTYTSVVTAPTCVTDGYTTHTCTACGDSYKDTPVAKLSHSYKETVVAATCTEDGYTTHICANCNDTYTDNQVAALGHDYTTETKYPTCTDGGYTTYTCNRCTDSYVSDQIDALGHDEEAIVTPPTCEDDGFTTYTCVECGETRIDDYVDALGHDYVLDVKNATCEEDGYTIYTCVECNYSFTSDETEATGHDYAVEVVSPSCEEDGYTLYSCVACNYSFRADEVSATGHDYAVEIVPATCTAGGYTLYYCVCGDSFQMDVTDPTDHKYVYTDNGENHIVTCENCDYNKTENHVLSGVNCALCNAFLCDHSSTEVVVNTPATCTSEGSQSTVCTICSATLSTETLPATGHNVSFRANKSATCTENGMRQHWRCENCDACFADQACAYPVGEEALIIAAKGHKYVEEVVAPTCDAAGYTSHTCSTCSDSYKTDEVPAIGHSYIYTDNGTTHIISCERCDYSKTEPHTFVEGVCICTAEENTDIDYSGKYYFYAIRTSGYYHYMSNDLGKAANKRYTAIDSGELTVPAEITDAVCDYVFIIARLDDGSYTITDCDGKYLSWVSGNTGLLTDTPMKVNILPTDIDGMVNITFAVSATETRYLSLNGSTGNNYFAWYKGTQINDIMLIPVTGTIHYHTYTAAVTQQPTCTAKGVTTYTCAGCGDSYTATDIDMIDHSYVYTDDGDAHIVTCETCDYNAVEQHTFVNGECVCTATESSDPKYIPDPTLVFNMNISAGADMKVVYTIYQKNLGSYTDFYLVVNKAVAGGEPVSVTYGFEEGMESFATTIIPSTGAAYMHRATFAGVYAREMGDVFEATLYAIGADGNIYYSNTNASSMKSYLTGKIDAADSIDELKTMCVDMLNYGAAAQLHFAYDTENLVNAGLTDAQKAYATAVLPEAVNSSATSGTGVTLRSSVSVKEKVYLNLTATYTPTDASALKAVICDAKGNVIAELPVTVKNNVLCQASYGEVGAKQMRQLLTATLYEGDKAVSTTITWSVESYVATVRANTNAAATQINMVNAMLTYGDAVAAYMTASGQ